MVITKYKTIALIWGLGFVLIGFGLAVDTLLAVDQSNPDVMTQGDWTTLVGFATFILSVILRLVKGFIEDKPETEIHEQQVSRGISRTFENFPVKTFLDRWSDPFIIVAVAVFSALNLILSWFFAGDASAIFQANAFVSISITAGLLAWWVMRKLEQ